MSVFCGDPDVAVTSVLKRYNLKLLKTKHMSAFSTRTNDAVLILEPSSCNTIKVLYF